MANIVTVKEKFFEEYNSKTPQRLKLIDVFLLYTFLTGVLQFMYAVYVGSYPFNSFLSGFISTVASFILAVCLRMQVNPLNHFAGISVERAFADYVFCNLVLFIVVINFIG